MITFYASGAEAHPGGDPALAMGFALASRYSFGRVKTWRPPVVVANTRSNMLPQAYLTWLLTDTACACGEEPLQPLLRGNR